jgi:hypothetical protein
MTSQSLIFDAVAEPLPGQNGVPAGHRSWSAHEHASQRIADVGSHTSEPGGDLIQQGRISLLPDLVFFSSVKGAPAFARPVNVVPDAPGRPRMR